MTATHDQESKTAGTLITTCLCTSEALEQVRPEWMALFERSHCENVFLTHAWMSEWYHHWHATYKLFVIIVRDPSGHLIAVAPFCISHSGPMGLPLRVVRFLGSEGVGSDHLSILVEPGTEMPASAELARFLKKCQREWDYIQLTDTEAASEPLRLLCSQFAALGLRECATVASICPYTDLPDSFEQYLTTLTANARYNFRRRRRALEREGSLEFLALSGAEEIETQFAHLLKLHRSRFESQGRQSAFLDATAQRFHATALRKMAAQSWARLYVLQLNGEVIAILYGFSVGSKFSFYQCGMDPAWSRFSVGLVMMGLTIQHAIRTGHREYDFLRGDEGYKSHWAKQTRLTRTVWIFDRSLKGLLLMSMLKVIQRAICWRKAPFATSTGFRWSERRTENEQ